MWDCDKKVKEQEDRKKSSLKFLSRAREEKFFVSITTFDVKSDKMTLRIVWREGGKRERLRRGRSLDSTFWHELKAIFSLWHRNNDTSNSPYCIVRTIFKFLIGSGFASTSSSSITTDDTLLESSADAAFIVFSTFPWSAKKRQEDKNERKKS